MEEITKKTRQEQEKILRKHMDELEKETLPATDYHNLLQMREKEKERKAKLQLEIEDWSKKLREKKEQIELLKREIHERQQVEIKQEASASHEETKIIKLHATREDKTMEEIAKEQVAQEIKTEQEANGTENNVCCDSDCDSFGESEWDAVESQASQVTR